MAIQFNPDRWAQVRETYTKWWDGSLKRPIFQVTQRIGTGPDPHPHVPVLSQATCADFSWTPEEVIDKIDWQLSGNLYHGDAYPVVSLSAFGPGIVAAMVGGKLDNSSGAVWFYPKDGTESIHDIHVEFDPHNRWLSRIKDLCWAGIKKWQGNVLIGMTDLGGTLDILASLRGSEELLYDLIDEPDEVKRIVQEIHTAWFQIFTAINEVLQPINPGYTDWDMLYYPGPGYILQSDFSFMISPDMFREFGVDELAASAKKLAYRTYHLDGVNALPHLDALLEIPELRMIQWQPGAGQPTPEHWLDVYRKIVGAGKKAHIVSGIYEAFDFVVDALGSDENLYFASGCTELTPEIQDRIRRYCRL